MTDHPDGWIPIPSGGPVPSLARWDGEFRWDVLVRYGDGWADVTLAKDCARVGTQRGFLRRSDHDGEVVDRQVRAAVAELVAIAEGRA